MVDKRAYASELRAEQARRTRRQIVDAAARLYEQQGFAATTVDTIAAAAGVSRKTVFSAVGGKVTLLKLAYDVTLAGDDLPIPMIDREGLQAVIAEPDPYRQLTMYCELVADMGRRVSRLWIVLRGAAEVDAEAADLFTRWEVERRDSMVTGPLPVMKAKGVIRPGLSDDEFVDLMYVFNDPALYHRLVLLRGWSHERFLEWLTETVIGQVLAPHPPGP